MTESNADVEMGNYFELVVHKVLDKYQMLFLPLKLKY